MFRLHDVAKNYTRKFKFFSDWKETNNYAKHVKFCFLSNLVSMIRH